MWERKKERHNECAISSKKGSSQTVKMHNNKKKKFSKVCMPRMKSDKEVEGITV